MVVERRALFFTFFLLCREQNMVYSLHNNGAKDDNNALTLFGVWNPFADTNDESRARSVTCVSGGREQGENDVEDDNDDANPSWSIVVGGGNGQMWVQAQLRQVCQCHP